MEDRTNKSPVVLFDAAKERIPKVILQQDELMAAITQVDTMAGAFGAIAQACATQRERLNAVFPILSDVEGTNYVYAVVMEMLARIQSGAWK